LIVLFIVMFARPVLIWWTICPPWSGRRHDEDMHELPPSF
jgi:hypothetical protein